MKPWVHWFEIPVADMARAKRFYEGIFGFKLKDLDVGEGLKMSLFPESGDGLSGGGSLIQLPGFYQPGTTGPMIYLDADPDLGLVLARVEKLGGKMLIPKRQITPERGYMGVFQDTEGNRIALHSNA